MFKIKNGYIIIYILLYIAFPIFGSFFSSSNPNVENRNLAEHPDWNYKNFKEYPTDYEAYFNDHLPFRNQLIQTKNWFSYFVLKDSPSEKVVIGKNDWLFYEETVADYKGNNYFSDKELEIIKKNLEEAKNYFSSKGIEFLVFIGPNKNAIYPEQMPDYYDEKPLSRTDLLVQYLHDTTDVKVIYPKENLVSVKNENSELYLYYHLDTHWNFAGGYIGAKALLNELGVCLPPLSTLEVEYSGFSGVDLVNMMHLNKYIRKDTDWLIKGYGEDNISHFSGEFINVWRYSSNVEDNRKIMICRDSFTSSMKDYIAASFQESIMPLHGYFKQDMIDEEEPDIFVYEVVERDVERLLNISQYDCGKFIFSP